ncbi:D-xylose ABC transporter substrate-binding protein [Thalassospira lucentensis]|uniref:D-xylose ABC transporter substrate-binding protein n=1 Tax=Thalassospira lucentensis TaxID=168935 RepID=UPI00142DCC6D|nr:D-xylose ABC transporter substrate-binding protein [Thalassospira lucentensis]NIZ02993.1 D-xylose ABC transporter substrate-binding protein [Thalassospira lucentensis]
MKKLLSTAMLAGTVLMSANAFAADLTVGVSWSNFQEERWKTDEAAIKSALHAAGAEYISADAQSSPSKQLSDIESLIARGADAIIVLAQDSSSIGPAVTKALNEGIPVVGYDRLIEDSDAYYITFNNKEVGRLQAEAVFAKQPKGNYVFIKGAPTDPNANILHEGQLEVLQDAIDSGDIKVVGEAYTESWQPAIAQRNMEQFLTAADNKVDAVVASNDGTAGGAVAALSAQGMQGIPVSGQDGDHAALNRVAQGTQTVSVWKDARLLGKRAAEIAVELAKGTSLDDVEGTQDWESPNGVVMKSYFLDPVAITQDKLNLVIDAGWVSKDVVCQGVTSDKVAACN